MSSTNMQNKTLIIGLVVVALVAVGAYFFPKQLPPQPGAVTTTAGTTFGTAKVALVTFIPLTSTSTSILNTDGVDRAVESAKYDCSGVGSSLTPFTGAGLANLVFQMSTTSTATPGSVSNSNWILNTTVSTSSPDLYVSSTTPGLTGSAPFRIWAAGSYLTITSNATNTAACVIGVNYFTL